MKLQFDVTIDDLIEFHRHFFSTSKSVRRQRRIVIGTVTAISATTIVLTARSLPLNLRLAAAALFAVFFPLMLRLIHTKSLDRSVRSLLAESGTEGVVGRHTLVADESGLTEETSVNETRHAWSAVQRIDETDDYVFIFISSLQAHTIPRCRVAAGDLDELVRFSRTMIARHAMD